ncbi:MAG TPA: CDP-diacylglycerol--glycerol-3-phosphate 3-phosphatidyltransferase [Spirochaetota bacterium]|nr:CDP-diacylglycerol--glycerol-3-phosphate 3-phosphatidyltransferase [Spirochaetota bacterium]HOD14116.1 CDP-diacylglycerol--glycerol-3-phosphate 3-phosphatidyltransferase [Spirochaetota bacterium]HPG49163.1 CDP-diacylglycerol--glycerol-3-phosphate 3-phosphatidyltransferase [Spirochaetota bacterium]HPN13371.1 CDP-diacylglycerol--glycerol-3-phosphate 3-phosphatidyltransferase [Spirochaetota bacterium]
MSMPKFSFTIPNLLSLSRIVLIPLLVYLLYVKSWWLALILFAAASLTDLLDGWSARKLKQESEFGIFIDPLADKFLVISVLAALMVLNRYVKIYDFWMIAVIIGRDVLITFMRYLAIRRGETLRTSRFGKVKTAFQMVSIVIIIMIYIVRKYGIYETHPLVPYWIMFGVTILTALSGLRYIFTNWRLFLPEKKTGGQSGQA